MGLKLVPERQITHNTFIPTEVLKTPAIITTDIMFCKKTSGAVDHDDSDTLLSWLVFLWILALW